MEAAGEKFFENLKNRLDSHDKLWYPVVTARLVNLTKAPPIHCKGMPATLFEAIRFLHSILLILKLLS